ASESSSAPACHVATGVVRRIEGVAVRILVTLRLAPDGPSALEGDVTAELDAVSFAALRPVAGERLAVRIPHGA
ncbi:ABC transporter ATP-binding protein, partial [Clavibacter michiganensis]